MDCARHEIYHSLPFSQSPPAHRENQRQNNIKKCGLRVEKVNISMKAETLQTTTERKVYLFIRKRRSRNNGDVVYKENGGKKKVLIRKMDGF